MSDDGIYRHCQICGGQYRGTVHICAEPRRAFPPAIAKEPAPIDMVLHCPSCGLQHIDAPDDYEVFNGFVTGASWQNPPHRSHLCHGCGHIWRPADVPTNGVRAVKTEGKNDSPIAVPAHDPGAPS